MKRVLFLFLFALSFTQAVARQYPVKYLSKDSLNHSGNEYLWLFHQGDSMAWAAPGFNDSMWDQTTSPLFRLHKPKAAFDSFSSIAWLRFHFIADTSIVEQPLAVSLSEYGASEVYIDGKQLAVFGKIDGANSEYYDPQYAPVAFVLHTGGPHVIAVRYANYKAAQNDRIYGKGMAGFRLSVDDANRAIRFGRHTLMVNGAICLFMFGLLMALSLIHLFMFFYYRAVRSNVFFSIFCFCISCMFLLPYMNRYSSSPSLQMANVFVTMIIVAAACYSISGFSNSLFSKGKRRFRIITIACIVVPLLYLVDISYMAYGYLLLICAVTLETVILIVSGMYKKVPGARIIGTGIIFFSLYFLFVAGYLLLKGNVEVEDTNTAAQLIELLGVLAIISVPLSISFYLAWSFSYINKNLQHQLQQVHLLSEKALQQEQEKQQLLRDRKEELEHEVALRTHEVMTQKEEIERQHTDLKKEKKKTDDLLMNILPAEVAEELKAKGSTQARLFDNVTVLFTDFVNFTLAGEQLQPQELIDELHDCFKAFDEITGRYNIEKIKTIGDAYLAVSGLPVADTHHAENAVCAAMEINNFMQQRKERNPKAFDIRIGIHTGSVVAGIVGVKKFAYDIWGDTVNTAARMEQNSLPGRINISQTTYELVKDKFACEFRGAIKAKNKGELNMYFVA